MALKKTGRKKKPQAHKRATEAAYRKKTEQINIPQPVFDAWQKARRMGDSQAISTAIGKSRPIVDSALNYGFCAKESTMDAICKFFADRLEYENNNPKPLGKEAKKLVSKLKA